MNNKNLPKHKSDHESVDVLTSLERSMVIPLLPELLVWLQDTNWPIASEIVDLLLKYTVEIIPHVKTIFSQSDSGWTYNIFNDLINEWEMEFVSVLSSSLRELAQNSDNDDDTDLLAIEILWKHHLIDEAEATVLLKRKLSDTEDYANNFTVDQRVMFSELENESRYILMTDASRYGNYFNINKEAIRQKDQYENLLRRYKEIKVTIKAITW